MYAAVVGLCIMMVFWVLFIPGSCAPFRAMLAEKVMAKQTIVPPSLIGKYAGHPMVCFTHVLPAAAWSALIPFQLHPASRSEFPRLHRIAGRVFLFLSALVLIGYALIQSRGLGFHRHDFPGLRPQQSISLFSLKR